ncbi:MAG: hypothetical protein ACM3X4_11130 [Ignavibacteriales bacterium]
MRRTATATATSTAAAIAGDGQEPAQKGGRAQANLPSRGFDALLMEPCEVHTGQRRMEGKRKAVWN